MTFTNVIAVRKSALIVAALLTISACGNSNNTTPTTTLDQPEPTFNVSLFDAESANINNTYFPLKPGTGWVYEGTSDEGDLERVEIVVSHQTKTIDGVESAIVIERNFEDGELIEETFDWYAQDLNNNVWYMGEASADYEDGEIISTAGSWESGKDIDNLGTPAIAGLIMKQNHTVGDSYQQEYYPGSAEDMAKIVNLNVDIILSNGDNHSTLKTREWNPLEPEAIEEFKYYSQGIGLVLEEKVDGSESIELIETSDQTMPIIAASNFDAPTVINNSYLPLIPGSSYTYETETDEGIERIVVEVLSDTRDVMGITNVVVRDRVYLDDVLIEDTHDWFAQDNAGNVWYFGEAVDNYNYDVAGELIDITHEGAWEAGVDGAQPGITMQAAPRVGDSYRQEYYQGEAEDLAAVAETDVSITLADGSEYTTLKVKEWNPLDPEAGFEHKFYAADVGLVREENEEGDEQIDLIAIINP